jgi:NAD-dependent dihydropyrimidine dehydrogenase PreA subunit
MKYEVDNCGCCGACVPVCPHQLLELTENEIIISEGCQKCGNCQIICPLGAFKMEDSK